MADTNTNAEQPTETMDTETATMDTTDYKALYEQQVEANKALEAERDKWKSHSRKNEARAKEASSKADASYEERIAEMEARLNAAEAEKNAMQHESEVNGWKSSIAKEMRLDADILRGDSEEEIRAHAESIRKSIGYPESASTGTPMASSSAPRVIPTVF